MSTSGRQVRVNSLVKGYSCVPHISFDDLSRCDLIWVLIYQINQLTSSFSVRAWRGLRVNQKYAEKLARKRERQLERQRAKAKAEEERLRLEVQRKNPTVNPFSVSLFSCGRTCGIDSVIR